MSTTARKAKPKAKPAPATWDVELWPLSRLTPYDRNAKPHSEAAIQKLATVIRKVGVLVPLVVDADGVILKGHRTRLAAMSLGLPTVPVRVARHLSAADAKAWRIADNRLGQDTAWDDELLRLDLTDLQGLDVDLGLTGFEPGELAALLNPSGGLQPGVDPDDVPETPKVAVTQPGDLIRLGRHRLLCGDATNQANVNRFLSGDIADLLFTDPPYSKDYESRGEKGECVKGGDFGDILASVALAIQSVTAWYVKLPWYDAVRAIPLLQPSNFIVWAKQGFGLGAGDFRPQHEILLYSRRGGSCSAGKDVGDVWNFPVPFRGRMLHVAETPVALIQQAILFNTQAGDRTLDLFAGCGTTIIACEASGRVCCAMELSPAYCDVIVTRWEAATGQTAHRPKVAA